MPPTSIIMVYLTDMNESGLTILPYSPAVEKSRRMGTVSGLSKGPKPASMLSASRSETAEN